MPYIKPSERGWAAHHPETAGQLNYALTSLILDYLIHHSDPNLTTLRYQALNDALGALEGAKLELYRRLGARFEDKAISANGDVYP